MCRAWIQFVEYVLYLFFVKATIKHHLILRQVKTWRILINFVLNNLTSNCYKNILISTKYFRLLSLVKFSFKFLHVPVAGINFLTYLKLFPRSPFKKYDRLQIFKIAGDSLKGIVKYFFLVRKNVNVKIFSYNKD